jgi:hypothetical protein
VALPALRKPLKSSRGLCVVRALSSRLRALARASANGASLETDSFTRTVDGASFCAVSANLVSAPEGGIVVEGALQRVRHPAAPGPAATGPAAPGPAAPGPAAPGPAAPGLADGAAPP